MSPEPLGRIDFDFLGTPTMATLHSNLRWECDVEPARLVLNALFTEYSPADGLPGAKLLNEAAAYFHGKATWLAPERPAPPGDIVY